MYEHFISNECINKGASGAGNVVPQKEKEIANKGYDVNAYENGKDSGLERFVIGNDY